MRHEKFESCLVVEDSEFDQIRFRRILAKSFDGVRVTVVSTLEGARKHLERARVSLILLDNTLPDGKGANFALELADDPRFATIPVIIISDWPSPFMFDKAMTAGVQHVVSKSDFGARYIHDVLSDKSVRKRVD